MTIIDEVHIVYMLAYKKNGEPQVGTARCSNSSNLEKILNSISVNNSQNTAPFLVYYELLDNSSLAKKWGNCLKQYSAEKKVSLVDSFNPEWNNLAERLDNKLNRNI